MKARDMSHTHTHHYKPVYMRDIMFTHYSTATLQPSVLFYTSRQSSSLIDNNRFTLFFSASSIGRFFVRNLIPWVLPSICDMQHYMFEALLPQAVLRREHAVQLDAQLFLGPQRVPRRQWLTEPHEGYFQSAPTFRRPSLFRRTFVLDYTASHSEISIFVLTPNSKPC
jgi:hypothetical protein